MFILRMGFLLFPQESVQVWPSCKSLAEQLLQAVWQAAHHECPPSLDAVLVLPARCRARSNAHSQAGPAPAAHTHTARQLLATALQSPAPLGHPGPLKGQTPTHTAAPWARDVFPCQSAERKGENIGAHVRSFHQTHVHSMGHWALSLSLDTPQHILFEKFPWAQIVKTQQFCKLDM